MRAISLMYHDVITGDDWDSSGFPGPRAAPYKMSLDDFADNLRAIGKANGEAASKVGDSEAPQTPLYITFDDGGVSAVHPIIDSLEEQGWRGHFFVTTDRIGTNAFVSKDDIRELAKRGHVVGSHSCSHPTRMAVCSKTQLQGEWSDSVAILADILGARVCVASVPGGYYSRKVATTAAQAGITTLFNSEPTTRSHMVGPCRVLGRYTIKRDTHASVAAALAANHFVPTTKQVTLWKAKKVAKLAGPLYLRVRSQLLG